MNYSTSVNVEVSNEYSINGDKSFKATTISPNNANSGYFYTIIDVEQYQYTFKAVLNNIGETAPVRLYARQGTSSTNQILLNSASCPSNEITNLILTITIPENYTHLLMMFPCVNGIVYIDDLILTSQ